MPPRGPGLDAGRPRRRARQPRARPPASGDLESALDLTGAALELCAAHGDRHREAALHDNVADLLHAAGRHEDAMDQLKRACAEGEEARPLAR